MFAFEAAYAYECLQIVVLFFTWRKKKKDLEMRAINARQNLELV